MNILVTGANGFVGKNLCYALKNVKNGLDKTLPLVVDEVFEYDLGVSDSVLSDWCSRCDFVFHLAGVNRSADEKDFMRGNVDFTKKILARLKERGDACPVMMSSSVQASLIGRYDAPYGKSKKAAEEAVFEYERETGAKTYVYRFPNLFGKWGRPSYNSVVATFCYNVARGLPVKVDNPDAEIELLYIDDLVQEMMGILVREETRCEYAGITPCICTGGAFCVVPKTYKTTVGEIEKLICRFDGFDKGLTLPVMKEDGLEKKLYSTYLSYLPPERAAVTLTPHVDLRGSFTEILKTEGCGQFSVNVSRPGITKGQHWHNSKWEIFVVVHGEGLIRQRRIDDKEIIEHRVNGNNLQAVRILPGYTHSIVNLSESEDLVTLMWANETFSPEKPDTFSEKV